MLVLSRKVNESIMIGEDVKITVVDVNGLKVRLGIEAPKSIAVDREEIYISKKKGVKDASGN